MIKMIKSSVVKAKIEPYLKKKAETVLHKLGITPDQAVTMLYKQIVQNHVWPIGLKIPNAKTLKVFSETDDDINLVKVSSLDELFKNLEA